jgi:long-chain acyl-CoA synthetase
MSIVAPTSMADSLRKSAARFPTKHVYTFAEKGKVEGITYTELVRITRGIAAQLRDAGVNRGDRVVIISMNRPEWSMADLAGQTLGAIVVPIYPTLPPDQAQYIVKDSEAKIVIAGDAELSKKVEGMEGVTVLALDDLRAKALNHDLTDEEYTALVDGTQPDDIATIIYTSGTTGLPKGAMLTHKGILHVSKEAGPGIRINSDDTFFCFLPMAHVFERMAGQIVMYHGGTSAYAKNLASIASDLATLEPTVVPCVPRFLESFRDRVLDGVAKQPPLRQKLFHMTIAQGTKRARGQFAPLAGILDSLVGKKVRARLGSRFRFFVSGGAALAPAVAEFYLALRINVLQGYGLTETWGGSVVNRLENNKYWTVGEPLGIEVKIAEDGEILLRGDAVMKGYYKLPEETEKAIDPEGYFHTGDIGEWEGKNLKITDRKKDLLVLGNGKNVAPQPIENKLKEGKWIEEAVVLGDGMENCVALIVPKREQIKAHLQSQGVKAPADHEFGSSEAVRKLIKTDIDAVNKTLAAFELVKKFVVLNRSFSIETGELTPTLKVKRKVIREMYAAEIGSMQR